MKRQGIWLAAMTLLLAVCTGLAYARRNADLWDEPAAGAMALTEENLFALSTPAPETEAGGFRIEVIDAPAPAVPRRVLIYHTHTYEAFEQVEGDRYQETEKWRTADPAHNMVRVGEELAGLLRGLGMEVVHDTTAFEPPVLSSAYGRSLKMLRSRQEAGETYDLYIDLHRDAYVAAQKGPNTVRVGGAEAARLMVLIGKGEGGSGQGFEEKPDWERNFALAERMAECVNAQAEGLCRGVSVKTGRYNQHVAACCVLVEAGNNRNTLAEVLAAMPYLAEAIQQTLESGKTP